MPLAVTSVSQLSASLVAALQAEVTQFVQENYPEAELTRGVIFDIILHLSGGVCGAITRTEVQRLVDSMSLLAIQQDPTLADDSIVDAVLSNYKITRLPGAAATGQIVITVTDPVSFVVPAGALYDANGVVFSVNSSFVAKPPGSTLLATNETLLTPAGGNLYSFTVPATATTTGAAGNIRRGTKMTPESLPDRFVTAFAATDFVGGADIELNEALLKRMAVGIAAPVMQGRTNIISLIKSQPAFATAVGFSIVGFGNPEMLRDQHGLFPVSGGGRIDIYARVAGLPTTLQLAKTATLVDVQGSAGVWQLSLARTDAPGFYDVTQIVSTADAAGAAGFAIDMDLRGFDLTGETSPLPGVVSTFEAAYSAYQTAVIRFIDTRTPLAGLTVGSSTADYVVAVRAMPQIADIQTFCRAPDHRSLSGDVLVKAAVPCDLAIAFDIEIGTGTATPDTAAIANAIAAAVNALDFPGRLNASFISGIAYGFLADRQVVGNMSLLGSIRRPDGTTTVLHDTVALHVTDLPSAGVTGRTVAFLCDPNDVAIRVLVQGFTEAS